MAPQRDSTSRSSSIEPSAERFLNDTPSPAHSFANEPDSESDTVSSQASDTDDADERSQSQSIVGGRGRGTINNGRSPEASAHEDYASESD
ncbi:hypothetical protein B0T26DRAFT_744997 [Lasiosphaeria miniovina]|uniref:Uncharacterized protein n=1 Tax=Lasiosphaeria miniovina TaxID=1954250 RepID=A0AA40BFA9_9PEZI|nr:uncharacterized protein B0T26DRAFT_744997 [Lasiosphaeria miniovina]KAK0732893.1 hypothetical protein B0T26DRAFT_744997 [Lasiosphaeria miniovina]